MGIETAVILGLTAVKAASDISAAKKDAKAIAKQGEQATMDKARETQLRVSKAKVSFLTSGFTLEGTPELSLTNMVNAGFEDINNIAVNADSKSKSIMGAARTKAIMSMAQTGIAGATGQFDGISEKFSFGTDSWNGIGQGVGSGFSSDAVGPFLPFGTKG